MTDTQMPTTAQVCERFQVSRQTIRRWINLGIFPKPIKVGGSVRFRPTDIEHFVTSGWLDARPGRVGGFASGWLPDQDDVAPEQLGTVDDVLVDEENNADAPVGE